MKKTKTLLAGLLLAASGLGHADEQLYYEDASAMWDSVQTLLAFVTSGSGQGITHTKVDFENWAPGQAWLNDHAILPRGALRVGFTNDPQNYYPNARFGASPWPRGTQPARDELFGRYLLRQPEQREGQRYLVIESKQPLVALAATLYNRTGAACSGALAPRLLSGSSLAEAVEVPNSVSSSEQLDPACPVLSGKVDIVQGIVKKTGLPFTQSFNYAVLDLGTPQRRVSVDNVVLYFAPDAR